MFISRSENWNLENYNPLQIKIVEGYWGDAKIEDIRCLLESVAKQILQYFDEPFSAHIFVECHPSRPTPEVNCRYSTGEHFVSLTTQDYSFWSYEFAHELCHVLSGHERLYCLPNKWFHEAICELASIFVMRQIAKDQPISVWQNFSAKFSNYAEWLVSRPDFQLPINTNLSDWFKAIEQSLRSNPDAPNIVLPGVKEPHWLNKARLFQQQDAPIPVFVKADDSQWEFVGQFRVEAMTQDPIEIQIQKKRYPHLNDIGGVIRLREKEFLPADFFSVCKKNGIAPTQFILIVSIAGQTVSLFEQNKFVKQFPCSTSRFGIGQTEGSNCTPLGLHRIAEKIGAGEPAGTVFKSRKVVGHTSQPEFADAKITTRILWLEGLEPGLNKGFNGGVNVDSHARYIYIHGTADQKSIGQPASHGCIHLADADLIPLFDLLPSGTLVWISENDS